MEALLLARIQFAFTVSFHILFPALTIGLAELTFRSREIGEYPFRFFEAFTAATVIYLVLAMTANRVMAWVERRTSVPGFIVGGK